MDGEIEATDETLAEVMKNAKFWEKNSQGFNDRQKMMLNKLLDGFEGKLISSKWAKIVKCSSHTAVRDIDDLVNRVVLIKEAEDGRSTRYRLAYEYG